MKKPSQATLTTPPLVEYVAVGRGAGVCGGLVGRGPATDPAALVVVVVMGRGGAIVAPTCGAGDGGGVGNGPPGLAGSGPRPEAGTVELGPLAFRVVLVDVVPTTDEPDSSSLTTSWWATTGAGRSVTSAATMDVAVHTMAVDAAVAASQSPVANK